MGDGVRPLIAVTTSEMRDVGSHAQTPDGEPPAQGAGAGPELPRLASRPPAASRWWSPRMDHDAIEPLLEQVSGVCLSGGPDLDPASYGAEAHPEPGPDRAAGRPLRARPGPPGRRCSGLPVLAICRGLQTLNVARGGTLHQHLPDGFDGLTTARPSPAPRSRTR